MRANSTPAPALNTAEFSVPNLRAPNESGDLAVVLTGLSGVAEIEMDVEGHRVRIHYDPRFVNPQMIEHTITKSGYGVAQK